MAAINIVLKAVDQYSSTITGLNQGFELVGKGIAGLTAIAEATWNAIKTGADFAMQGVQKAVELAVKGGNYAEMARQFKIVADSFDVDGDRVIKSLNDITFNVISMTDAVRLAGKGVAAGFDEAELETIFTFVKRRTELTGESFNQMAETIISSMAKGRFTTLKEFGLIIEKGSDTEKALQQIKEATKAYGDTGFNTGDNISALNNQQDRFLTIVGKAINSSIEWEKVIISVTDAVVNFVDEFNPQPITDFFNTIGRLLTALQKSLESAEIYESVALIIKDIRKDFGSLESFMVSGLKRVGDVAVKTAEITAGITGIGAGIAGKLKAELDSFWNNYETETKKAALEAARAYTDDQVKAIVKSVDAQVAAFNSGGLKIIQSAQNTTAAYVEQWQKAFEEVESEMTVFTGSAEKLVDDFDSTVDDIFSDLDKMEAGLSAPVGGIVDQQAKPAPASTIQDTLASANWPSEFAAMGEFMFKWVLSVASGSSLPMAVTTTL